MVGGPASRMSPGATVLIDGSDRKLFRGRTLNLAGNGVWRGGILDTQACHPKSSRRGRSTSRATCPISSAPSSGRLERGRHQDHAAAEPPSFWRGLNNAGLVEVRQGSLLLRTTGTSWSLQRRRGTALQLDWLPQHAESWLQRRGSGDVLLTEPGTSMGLRHRGHDAH